MKAAVRALLEGAFDYAGMYPPASLPLEEAISNFHRYRAEDTEWLLGRLIVPAEEAVRVPDSIPVSAIGRDEVLWDGEGNLPAFFPGTYVECPVTALDALPAAGLFAKIRLGGAAGNNGSDVSRIAEFIERCVALDLPCKIDAGPGAVPGFLEILVFTMLQERSVLFETDRTEFVFTDEGLGWRGRVAGLAAIEAARGILRSFGLWSFEEPVQELRALRLLEGGGVPRGIFP